jgi:hypothetical protein
VLGEKVLVGGDRRELFLGREVQFAEQAQVSLVGLQGLSEQFPLTL